MGWFWRGMEDRGTRTGSDSVWLCCGFSMDESVTSFISSGGHAACLSSVNWNVRLESVLLSLLMLALLKGSAAISIVKARRSCPGSWAEEQSEDSVIYTKQSLIIEEAYFTSAQNLINIKLSEGGRSYLELEHANLVFTTLCQAIIQMLEPKHLNLSLLSARIGINYY